MSAALTMDIYGTFENISLPYLDTLFQTAAALLDSREAKAAVEQAYVEAYRKVDRRADSTRCRQELFRCLFLAMRKRRKPGGIRAAATPDALRRALRAMPGELAEVLLLVDVHGLSYEESAAILSIAGSDVEERIRRGRDVLMDTIAKGDKS